MKKLLITALLVVGMGFAREYIAIIDFESIGVTDVEALALTKRLKSEMITLEVYQVLERSKMKELLEETKFQNSGCVDLHCAVEIGKIIGAKYMVVGSISQVGSTYSVDASLLNVETSESYISAIYSTQNPIDHLLSYGMKSIAYQLSEKEPPKEKYIRKNTTEQYTVKATEDIYPYFSDTQKQLEFEERKIIVNEVNEKEMYISGCGSEFNWLSILNPHLSSYAQQPLYLNSDTETHYRYFYKFELIQGDRLLSELEFLQIVGLQDKFDKIVNDYNTKVEKYNRKIDENKPYEADRYDKYKHIKINGADHKKGKFLKYSNSVFMGYFGYMASYSFAMVASPPNDNPELKSHYIKSSLESSLYLFLFYKVHKWITTNDKYKLMVINKINNPEPELKQTLTSKQLTSIAESYNRSLYEEIQLK